MSGNDVYAEVNKAKIDMGHIYNEPDPRAYFLELNKLDYRLPGEAKPIFEKLISLRQRSQERRPHVLDLGCSYGVNAALLKHDMSMSELFNHWGQEKLSDSTPEEVLDYDRHFFGSRQKQQDIEITGLDPASKAVTFAKNAGLINKGIAVDLEVQSIPEPAKPDLRDVDLVTSTGCVGYVTEKSFERLLPAITRGELPWVANFVLRQFPFDAIEETLSKWVYVTEKLENQTFVQRRFANDEEQKQMIEHLDSQSIDSTGKEADGFLHAEFYLSRPAEGAKKAPLNTLLAA